MAKINRTSIATEALVVIVLFGLALWLRATDLAHFVTADEHNWIYRSGVFLHAFLTGDYPGTSVWLTPGVTTTWLGSASLAVYYQLHQAEIQRPFLEWLISFSRNKVDLDILVVMRWSMALFTALMVVVVYGLARKLWPLPLALLGTLFLLADPHLLSVSRIIGHDALATMLIMASLLSFLCAKQSLNSDRVSPSPPAPLPEGEGSRTSDGVRAAFLWLILSGGLAGIGILSKSTTMILIPFVGLITLTDIWFNRSRLKFWIIGLLIWAGAMWLAFIAGWPAAWVDPLLKTWEVINNAFLSSAGLEDADIQPFVTIPELGYSYYLINGLYKLSLPVTIGLILAGIGGWQVVRQRTLSLERLLKNNLFWLALFALLFGLFMSLGVKRSPRYSLPIFPALGFVAAWGWLYVLRRFQPRLVIAGLGAIAIILTLLYAPYYFTYYNPLLGGAYTAPHMVRIGWGEGLDEVGRWLDAQPETYVDRVGARYTATLHPIFQGQIASPDAEELDYVTFYIKQSQSGYPSTEILRYFEQQGPLHRVRLNGIDYAQTYKGPGMTPITDSDQPDGPLAYRPSAIYAPIGQLYAIELLWPTGTVSTVDNQPITLTLQLPDSELTLDAPGFITEPASDVVISHHQFDLPADLPRAEYELRVDEQLIGLVKARRITVSDNFQPLDYTVHFLKLRGIDRRIENNRLLIDLAWQAWPNAVNDYTVFIQLLDENGQRISGVDVAPQPGFSQLDRKEIIITSYDLPIPEDTLPGSYKLLIGLYYFIGDELVNIGAETLPEPIQIGQPSE